MDENDMTVFDSIKIQAEDAMVELDMQIGNLQKDINVLRSEKRRLMSVIKAATDAPSNGRRATTKPEGIRLATRQKIMDAVRQINANTDGSFTVEDIRLESNLAESTVARAITVLREEGMVRQTGVVGRAPVYKWVGG